jgi:hypothetical protein
LGHRKLIGMRRKRPWLVLRKAWKCRIPFTVSRWNQTKAHIERHARKKWPAVSRTLDRRPRNPAARRGTRCPTIRHSDLRIRQLQPGARQSLEPEVRRFWHSPAADLPLDWTGGFFGYVPRVSRRSLTDCIARYGVPADWCDPLVERH